MIEWTDSLSIGVEEIDQQHRILITRFNTFADAVRNGDTKESLNDILLFMWNYALFHFEAEEALMRKIAYPGIIAHIHDHHDFMGRQTWLYESLRIGSQGIAEETVEFLQDWITRHVSCEDKKLGRYVELNAINC